MYSACLRAAPRRARKVSVCTTVGLTLSADAHDHRALQCQALCRARAGASPAAHAPRNCAGHARAKQLRWARAHAASQPSGRTPAIDIARLIARYPPACLPTQTTSWDFKTPNPRASRSMLRLLLVALPLVVALPAAFDRPEVNALQFEFQPPLQLEVRSPPESRFLRPAATQDQHDSPSTHSTLHSARTPPAKRTHHHGRAAAH